MAVLRGAYEKYFAEAASVSVGIPFVCVWLRIQHTFNSYREYPMNRYVNRIALATALVSLFGMAHANPTMEKNGVLATKDGRTLYTFDKDAASKSNCNGACIAAWPAFTVANPAAADADFTVIKRDDGSTQWAFQGKPLYFFAGDAQPGDMNGDKSGGVWHVVPAAKKAAAAEAPKSAYSY